MVSLEGATFILRTCDLPTNVAGANQYGSTNPSASSFTWKNVDLRSILGTCWDEYDYFNIALVNCVSTVMPAGMTFFSNDEKVGVLYMQGLKWDNCSFDVHSSTYVPYAPIGFINYSALSTTVATSTQYNSLSYLTFAKSAPILDITIFYNTVYNNTNNITGAQTFPQLAFMFKIVPLKKEERSFSSNRIF